MGTTGVIFAAIAIAWLAYLVPHFARRPEHELVEQSDGSDRFSDSMRIVRRGTAPLLNQDLAEIGTYEVSTPMTRRAAVNDLRRLEHVAAARRRRVLLVLLGAFSLVLGLCGAGLTSWWLLVLPGALLVAFVTVARFSVHAMRRNLDARYQAIRRGSDESTVLLTRKDLAAGAPSVAAKLPAATSGVLWDPVPITMPTYVSKPLAPRTVRTIDLSGPGIAARAGGPVTADAPATTRPAATRLELDGEGQQAASA